MLIIGERINTSRKVKGERVVEAAVVRRDGDYIATLATKQYEAGATYIDINCGTLISDEPDALAWLTGVVQEAVAAPISFDTPNPEALDAALAMYDRTHGQPLVNSITAETERYTRILPVVQRYGARVIALSMDDTGIQRDPARRLAIARKLVTDLIEAGVPAGDIFVDPLTFPIGTGDDTALALLDILRRVTAEFPGIHTIAGVSNVSHGMPARKLLNQAMTVLAMGAGLDAAILDPNDRYLMALVASADALLGRDEDCGDFIELSRDGAFEGL
jgi:cobalamin-dependent methionine synthase I